MHRHDDGIGGDNHGRRARRGRRVREDRDGGVAVGVRVRVYPGSDAEAGGIVVEDFGEMAGHGVDIGDRYIDPARRWAVILDAGGLVFVDTGDLAAQ